MKQNSNSSKKHKHDPNGTKFAGNEKLEKIKYSRSECKIDDSTTMDNPIPIQKLLTENL